MWEMLQEKVYKHASAINDDTDEWLPSDDIAQL